MTVRDIIYNLRSRLNDDTVNEHGEYDDKELIQSVNLALNEFCERTKCYSVTEAGAYADGFMLTEITHPITATISDGSNSYVLQRVKPSDKYTLYDIPTGTPRYYSMANRTLSVFPLEDKAYTISVSGYGARKVASGGEDLDFLTDGDYPYLMLLCEIFARSTRQHDDDNRYICNHYRDQIERYYQIRGRF